MTPPAFGRRCAPSSPQTASRSWARPPTDPPVSRPLERCDPMACCSISASPTSKASMARPRPPPHGPPGQQRLRSPAPARRERSAAARHPDLEPGCRRLRATIDGEPCPRLHPEGRAVGGTDPCSHPRAMTIRIVLADDALLLREGIARLLGEAGFDVVAQAGDATSLLSAVREHHPDVAITDIRMPPTHTDEGLRAAESIREEHGDAVGVLVLSQYVDTTFALRLVADGSGGMGYLLKDRVDDLEDFADAV